MGIRRQNRSTLLILLAVIAFSMLQLSAAKLREETVKAWNDYVGVTEERISREVESTRGFLAADFVKAPEVQSCQELLHSGGVCVIDMRTEAETSKVEVPNGRIHHWLGSILIPGARLNEVIDWVQEYDRHKKFYDDVEESRLISRKDNFFQIFLRLKRKKVITVHYNTNHEVTYFPLGPDKLYSTSVATSIREIESPGSVSEKEKPAGNDNGFLWRLNSYWRYRQTSDGVIVECESLSLSRKIPSLLFMLEGIVNSTAREALQYTLGNLRDGYLQESH